MTRPAGFEPATFRSGVRGSGARREHGEPSDLMHLQGILCLSSSWMPAPPVRSGARFPAVGQQNDAAAQSARPRQPRSGSGAPGRSCTFSSAHRAGMFQRGRQQPQTQERRLNPGSGIRSSPANRPLLGPFGGQSVANLRALTIFGDCNRHRAVVGSALSAAATPLQIDRKPANTGAVGLALWSPGTRLGPTRRRLVRPSGTCPASAWSCPVLGDT